MLSVALMVALTSIGVTAQYQQSRVYRGTDRQVRQLIRRIENRSDEFRQSVAAALDQSRIDGTNREDNINQFVSDFEMATNQLRDRFNRQQSVVADVQAVLDRAALIDRFMRRNRLGGRAEQDWASLRLDLSELANTYGISNWRWNNNQTGPVGNYPQGNNYPPNNQGSYAANRLTGTYRLDATRSDDARQAAERAIRFTRARNRQAVLDALTARLESPTSLAIDRRGRTVTIASTRAPQFTFEADGVDRVETGADGRSVRVRSTLNGDQLIVSSAGNSNSDFSVTFDPINNGRSLRVTRRITDINLTAPVTVISVYDKTSDIAELNIYNGGSAYPNTNTGVGTGTTSGDFIIQNGTQLVAVLNENLTTRDTRENDRFTMTVRQPSQYDGATITGYVTGVNRSGRISGRSEMTLNFESIRMRDGRSYRFAGYTESVRTTGGETVRVDNEGAVQDTDSRGGTTAKRAGIGTAVGAIIGAIAGGGKGAAIGAIIGAGAGAGSVYVQGSDDLQLMSGTEVVIRATGPGGR
jgi:hypothetical protein